MHLIDSLEFDVALASEELAFQEQERLQAFVRGPALRVIHSVFDEWSPPHEAWRLERLELDLGVVVGNDRDTVWEQRLRDSLHEALSRLRQGAAVARDTAATFQPAFPAQASATTAAGEPARNAPTQLRAPADLDALLHFLHHGVLPWHVVLAPGQRLADWAGAIALDAATMLAQHLQRSPRRTHMVRRLAQQLPAAALCPLAQALGLPAAWPLASWVAAAARRTMVSPGNRGAVTTVSPDLHEDAPGPAGGEDVVATVPRATLGALQCRLWESVLIQAVTLAEAGTRPRAGQLRRALDGVASAVTGTSTPAMPVGRADDLPNLARQLRTTAQRKSLARRLARQLAPAQLAALAHTLGLPASWPLADWVAVAALQPAAAPAPAAVPAAKATTTAPGSAVADPVAPVDPAAAPAPAAAATDAEAVRRLQRQLWVGVLLQAATATQQPPQVEAVHAALREVVTTARRRLDRQAQRPVNGRSVAPPHDDPHGHERVALSEWPPSDDPAALDAAVRDRLSGNPAQLRGWLLDTDRQGQRRRWLAASLSRATWNDLLKSLAPGAAPTLQCLLRRRVFGGAWLRLSRQPWPQTLPMLREVLLDTLLNPATARRATDPLLTAVVERTAIRFHTTSETLIAALRAELARKKCEPAAAKADLDALTAWLRSKQPGDATPVAAGTLPPPAWSAWQPKSPEHLTEASNGPSTERHETQAVAPANRMAADAHGATMRHHQAQLAKSPALPSTWSLADDQAGATPGIAPAAALDPDPTAPVSTAATAAAGALPPPAWSAWQPKSPEHLTEASNGPSTERHETQAVAPANRMAADAHGATMHHRQTQLAKSPALPSTWSLADGQAGATPDIAPAMALEPDPTAPVSTAAAAAWSGSRQGDEPQPLPGASGLRKAGSATAKRAPATGTFGAPWQSAAAAPAMASSTPPEAGLGTAGRLHLPSEPATASSAPQVLGPGPATGALRQPFADGARPVLQPAAWPAPPQPAQALALALRRHDADAAWLAWQACEATDPAGATLMLAALCRQPALRTALAALLPERRQVALVRRVAAAAAPLLRDWRKHRGSPELHRATLANTAGDVAAGDRGAAFWSAWWGAWAEYADPARPSQIAELADPATSATVTKALRAFAAVTQQAAPVGARPPALSDTAHGAQPSLSTTSLPTLLQQWQASAGMQPLPPRLRHEWHRACATAGARAWLIAALSPASLKALAAQLAPSASALNAACTGVTLWSTWPSDPAAAWSQAGWWRLWLARWASAPAELTFDCGSGLDAWFVRASRASTQALPVYLDGLLQRLQAVPAPGAAAGASTQAGAAAADDDADRARSFVRECAQAARARVRSRMASRAESKADSGWNSPDAWLARQPSKGLGQTRATAADSSSADPRVRADDAVPDHGVAEAATPTRWRAPPAPSLPIGEAVTVANAGLALLAGFTPRLFATLGWLHDRRFVDDATAGRAVHLLQWLVDERADAEEHELVLNRLLCGLPLATPVPRQVWWQAGECDVAQQMLQGVIAHWSALGRTSVQGLRESFLQREGRLVREEAGWRLHVAPRAFDMLLDRLPWSYAMLKLPWMPEVLHVDWR